MKKWISILLAFIMVLSGMTGCAQQQNITNDSSKGTEDKATADAASGGRKLKIVATIFPEYDWVREIMGDLADQVELTLLLDNGADMHSYQPAAEDIMKLADCDMLIYVGGESDNWIEDALQESTNPDKKVINLMDVLGNAVKEEELVEGMEGEAEKEDEESSEGENKEEEPEYDEHVWLSVKNAQILCSEIADQLGELDEANADTYQANLAAYKEKLMALDNSYQKAVDNAATRTVLFGDRFPFRYLTEDYGIDYYAAFPGCSAETEASFETITFLAQKVDELGLSCVLTIEKSDDKIANTIIENTRSKDQKILTMDSMQSTTSEDIAGGTTYLSVMEDNLQVLTEALQ